MSDKFVNQAIGVLVLAFAFTPLLGAQRPAAVENAAQIIPLWPEGVPGAKPDAGPELAVDGRVSNVQVPTLTYFPAPPATSVGTAIIICPGGGYARLAFDKEGTDVAKRLNAIGVSAFVLKYRLSNMATLRRCRMCCDRFAWSARARWSSQ